MTDAEAKAKAKAEAEAEAEAETKVEIEAVKTVVLMEKEEGVPVALDIVLEVAGIHQEEELVRIERKEVAGVVVEGKAWVREGAMWMEQEEEIEAALVLIEEEEVWKKEKKEIAFPNEEKVVAVVVAVSEIVKTMKTMISDPRVMMTILRSLKNQ